jgi:outer membrane protein assembly factor BamB
MESNPWYRSLPAVVIASIIFAPVGLVLLWLRAGDSQKKIFGSIAVIALGIGQLVLLSATGVLPNMFVKNPDADAHYTELERHRAEQREAFAKSAPASSAEAQPAPSAPNANSSQPVAAVKPVGARAVKTYWTDYRGPNRDGRYEEAKVLTAWPSDGPKRLWREPIGGGYASFVVAEGVAFTIEQRRRQEVVAAYDVETGRELWTAGWDTEFVESMGGDGPRATPTWHEGRVYGLGATGELRCLDAKTGKQYWGRNILNENGAKNLEWGMAASPLVVDDKVIVLPGGQSGKSVVAYNRMTGEPIWKSLNDRQAYVSPMLAQLAGQRQIVAVSSSRVVGLKVEDGSLLWEYPWNTQMGINCSQPIVVSDNRFFISSGYGKGAALVELTRNGNSFSTRTVWENTNMKNKFNSSVFYQGHIYGLDETILTCVAVETGARKWKGGRYGYGQVLLANGHLILTTEEGDVVLVKATPDQHTEVARFSALEGRTWNYPAIAGGRLLVRNSTHMACYNISAE